jgi:hypothetical protein
MKRLNLSPLNRVIAKIVLTMLLTALITRLLDQTIVHQFLGDEYCNGNINRKVCNQGWSFDHERERGYK